MAGVDPAPAVRVDPGPGPSRGGTVGRGPGGGAPSESGTPCADGRAAEPPRSPRCSDTSRRSVHLSTGVVRDGQVGTRGHDLPPRSDHPVGRAVAGGGAQRQALVQAPRPVVPQPVARPRSYSSGRVRDPIRPPTRPPRTPPRSAVPDTPRPEAAPSGTPLANKNASSRSGARNGRPVLSSGGPDRAGTSPAGPRNATRESTAARGGAAKGDVPHPGVEPSDESGQPVISVERCQSCSAAAGSSAHGFTPWGCSARVASSGAV